MDRLSLKAVDCLGGSLHRRNSFCELLVASRFLGFGLICKLDCFGLLYCGGIGLDLGVGTLLVDNLNELVSLLLLVFDVNHLDLEQVLEGVYLLYRRFHNLKTDFKSVDLVRNLALLLCQKHFVEFDQLKERGRGSVVVSSLKGQKFFVGLADGKMGLGHVAGYSLPDLVAWELDVNKLSGGDIYQSASRPLEEPIDRSAVDDSWEHSGSDSEQVSDWGEAEAKMEVSSHLVEEEVEEFIWDIVASGLLGFGPNLTDETVELVLREEVRDPSSGQEIVNVDQEFLVSNLSISKDEEELGTRYTCLGEHGLDVSLEVSKLVAGSNDDSDDIVSEDEG